MKSVQSAGTGWATTGAAGSSTRKAPMMIVQPTLDMAERWSKQRLAAMIEDCPNLRAKIAPARPVIPETPPPQEWAGGVMVISGANSGASLRSMPARYVFLDEIDAYRRNWKEGRPDQTGGGPHHHLPRGAKSSWSARRPSKAYPRIQ